MRNRSPAALLFRALERWGGAIVAPRRTIQALDFDEGSRDGLLLGALYVAGTSVYPMTAAIATVMSTGSIVALASGVARVLLTPIVVTVLAETLLGRGRSYRGGLTLLPLLVISSVAHVLALAQLPTLPGFWPDVVGAACVAGYALWIRSVVPIEPAGEKDS